MMKWLILVLLVICAALGQDTDKEGQERGLRDLNQDWKGVDYLSPVQDTSGWIPQDTEPIKRRRVRKRKRRPPVFEAEIKEPWEEIEEIQKSNNRRRLTPIYDETQEVTQTYEKIRDPFTALQEAEEKQKSKVEESTTDLKALLKQSGGLSLSEVLQQKNLTLSELLKGDKKALSVLVKQTETTTEGVKYRRLPPSIGLKKDKVRVSDASDRLTSHEVVEAQKKRLTLLHKVDVVTEETTERRVFVPPTTTTTIKPRRKLPMTSAKLNKMVSPPENVSKLPEKAVAISITDIFNTVKNESDGPFRMVFDLGDMVTTTNPPTTTKFLETTISELGRRDKYVTAKEEIMEILRNPLEREHLARILRTRNMTVEELVEQRERGSSQLHLADIFHNKTREPEPLEEVFEGRIQPDAEDLIFNRKPKTLALTPEALPPTVSSQKNEREVITKLPYTITSFPTYKIETNKDIAPFLPIWQQIYPHFFTNPPPAVATTEKIDFEELERLEEIENALAEANSRPKPEIHDESYEDDGDDFVTIPSGVKSAILASLAIIGLSLLVFLTILLVFKWSQKQKRRLNYNGSFSGSKIRSPILEPDQRRTFRTFVSETLGRKKNYYKAHLQSMSDSIWDKDEKKSYMI